MKRLLFLIPLIFVATGFDCGGNNGGGGSNNNPQPVLANVGFRDDVSTIQRALSGRGIPKEEMPSLPYTLTTPAGNTVKSVVPVPPETLAAYDDGIKLQIERINTYHPEWTKFQSVSQYPILVIHPSQFRWQQDPRFGQKCINRENDPGSPCLITNGIQTAGTVIGADQLSPVAGMYIVLPEQTDSNWTHLEYSKASARNESEHLRECGEEGKAGPTCLQYQVVADVHPHFP
jgi:hypothetical protein